MANPFRKLSFEHKILGAFFLTLLVGISALNVAAVALYKAELMDGLREQVRLHLALFETGEGSLPPYIILSERPLQGEDLVLYDPSFRGKFVFLDLGPAKKRLWDFALGLFLWESVLVLGLSYVLYKLLGRYLRDRERTRETLELLLLALSHRLGNFLAAQRVNLEILRERPNPEVLDRLEKAYGYIEEHFRRTLELVRLLPKGEEEKEVDLGEVVRKVLRPFGESLKGKDLELELSPVRVRVPVAELELILQALIENAVKYSDRWIRIALDKAGKSTILTIENDLAPDRPPGSGLGLEVARRLAGKIGLIIETEEGADCYRQVVIFGPVRSE